tara:strand:+ start:408 stop:3245 length:2838 start_codon:yes stop_codon:yes gene_type:complete
MPEPEDEVGLLEGIGMDFGIVEKSKAYKKEVSEGIAARSTAGSQAQNSETPTTAETEPAAGDVKVEAEEEGIISQRFEEQCFLMDAIDDFAKENSTSSYKNFLVLDAGKEDTAKLVSKINSRFEKPSGAGLKSFLSITPAQRAMLIPKIRLFVQKFKSEEDKLGVIQELHFKDWTQQSSIEDIMKTATGRGDAAGLISFSYTYNGKDPGSTDNMIETNVKMLFTDFETISKPIRRASSAEKKHMGAGTRSRSGLDYLAPKFLDLILRQPTRKHVQGKTLPYLIKVHAEIGWQTPENVTNDSNILPPKLKKYIADGYLNEYFVMTMTEHELDFKEDGRIELSIDFQSAIENALFTSTDVLRIQNEEKLRAKLNKSRQKSMEDRQTAQASIDRIESHKEKMAKTRASRGDADAASVGGFISRASDAVSTHLIGGEETTGYQNLDQELKIQEKRIKIIDDQMRLGKERLKTKKYRSFMENLEKGGNIKFVDLKSNAVKKWQQEIQSEFYAGKNKKNRFSAREVLKQSGTLINGKLQASVQGEGDIKEQALVSLKKAIVVDAQDDLDKHIAAVEGREHKSPKASKLIYDKTKADALVGPDTFRVHYVYLGDILDVACKTLYDLPKHNGILRIVAGPVQYISSDGTMQNINLSDIPVSLEAFSVWMYKNIISKGVAQYSLGSFLNSMVTELVYEALGSEKCFAGVSHPSMIMTPIMLNLEGTGKRKGTLPEVVKRKPSKSGRYPRTSVNAFARAAKNNLASRGAHTGQQRVNVATYVFITGLVREENNFNYGVNATTALKDGICKFGIGRDRGIVNNIKFGRVDTPYQAEMRVEQRETSGKSVLGEFRQVYNATVKLIGNTLFKVGQYVYIDPSSMGVDKKTATTLGLGGYYSITKVDGELSRNGYETVLECTYNSEGSPQSIRRNRKNAANKKTKAPRTRDALPITEKL